MRHISTHIIIVLTVGVLLSCNRDEIVNTTINKTVVNSPEYLYELETLSIQQEGVSKPNEKTLNEFASIAYFDLFQQSIPQNELTDLLVSYASFGDKVLIEELIVRNYLNSNTSLAIPSTQQMNDDVEGFVNSTYQKLYNRLPNDFEAAKLKELILGSSITSELVYFSFMTADEYRYY